MKKFLLIAVAAGLAAYPLTSLRATAPSTIAAPAGDSNTSDEAELAKQINNPVAALISVPFQGNDDFHLGPTHKGYKFTLNIQPVIPISISQDWNLILRTIVPIISQQDLYYVNVPPYPGLPDQLLNHLPPSQRAAAEEAAYSRYIYAIKNNPQNRSQDGFGDTTQSFFLSPKAPGWEDIIWGLGPVLYYPTATQDLLGAGKWGAGPTAVALKQTNGWTIGMLANQIWSIDGQQSRQNVNATFLQPFLTYTTKTYTTVGANTESTYNWTSGQWSVPINFWVSQIFKIGGQPMSLQLGARYYAQSSGPAYGHGVWGVRVNFTLLFPLHHAAPEEAPAQK